MPRSSSTDANPLRAIQVDNPFLPANIRDAMIAGGIPSLTVGVANAGNMVSGNVSLREFEKAVSINIIKNNRELRRGVFTLDGAASLFGEDWTWEAYLQHSSLRETQQAPYNTFNVNYGNAIDAVQVSLAIPQRRLQRGTPRREDQCLLQILLRGTPLPFAHGRQRAPVIGNHLLRQRSYTRGQRVFQSRDA